MYVKLYLSEEEKTCLERIAEARGISLSSLCYSQILPLLRNPLQYTSLDASKKRENCDRKITLHLTSGEYDFLIKKANGTQVSKYLRNMILYHTEPVNIVVYTDDISALSIKVTKFIEHFEGFVAALALHQQLYEADYKRLTELAEDIKDALRDTARNCLLNRKSIRSSGVKILKQEIKRELSKFSTEVDNNDGNR